MAQLDAKLIASTALAILDDRGFASFSLRAVARALDVTPMALYHHVRDKAELASLVVTLAAEERPLAPPIGVWREDLWVMASWMRASALAHPATIELRRIYHIWTPAIVAMAERWMCSWQASGLEGPDAVRAATTSSAAITGLLESSFRDHDAPSPDMNLRKTPNAQLLLSAVNNAAEIYELGVRSVIDGLHVRLMREQGGMSKGTLEI